MPTLDALLQNPVTILLAIHRYRCHHAAALSCTVPWVYVDMLAPQAACAMICAHTPDSDKTPCGHRTGVAVPKDASSAVLTLEILGASLEAFTTH